MIGRRMALALAGVALVLTAGCHPGPKADASLTDADPANWPAFGRTPGSQDYSPLARINTSNIGQLALAWAYDLEPAQNMTAPVEADGVLYVSNGLSVVTALDAATGRRLWRYDPHAAEAAPRKLRRAWGSRGLAFDQGRVFVGTPDARLIALDGKTGKLLWSVETNQPGDDRYITGAPRPFAGKVLIGHAGGDQTPARGYVTCYDAKTGRQLWRFYTVPGAGAPEDATQAMAAKTWFGEGWKAGAGGVVWHAMSYDPEFNRVYIGTGNPEPEDRQQRTQGKGDNLFTSSIVALDADTGKYVWHYQVNPGEEWDFDASMDMQPATLMIDGKPRKVLMQAPKNGFFYVIDRTNGKLISAEPFARQNWASKIDLVTGRPVEIDASHYHGKGPYLMWPTPTGAHAWLPMSFSPKTGLVYIPVSDRAIRLADPMSDYDPQMPEKERGWLKAWDPVRQKAAWQVETPDAWPGGVMSTGGGLVFQGQVNHAFNAYDAASGKRLWSFDARAPATAPPITYEVGGVQYVTVVTGFGGVPSMFIRPDQRPADLDYRNMPRRVLTFAIGGKASLPATPKLAPQTPPADPQFKPDPARAQAGMIPYMMNCMFCHGPNAVANGAAPDLRFSGVPVSPEAFAQVVHGGALIDRGMPKFDDLTPAQLEGIRFYVRSRIHDTASAAPAPARRKVG